MLLAADYYIEKEDLFVVGEDQKIRLVSLKLVILALRKQDKNLPKFVSIMGDRSLITGSSI